MTRFSHYDTDEERLPEGMVRVGYDADNQVHTFRDPDGSYWEGKPGCRYGSLTRVSNTLPQINSSHEVRLTGGDDGDDDSSTLGDDARRRRTSWRADLMPLLNFFVLVGVALMSLVWFLSRTRSRSSSPPSNTVVDISGDVGGDVGEGNRMTQGRLDSHTCGGLEEWKGGEESGIVTHVVREGDTCWLVAREYGVSLEALIAANEEVDCDSLAIGAKLCVSLGDDGGVLHDGHDSGGKDGDDHHGG